MRKALVLVAASLALSQGAAKAAQTFTVEPVTLADEKAVFATVESIEVVPARVRTGGTIASLSVREGDRVTAGQVVATIGDEKLTLQKDRSMRRSPAWRRSSRRRRPTSRARQPWSSRGIVSKAQLDEATTAANVAANALKARVAERAVIEQQLTEGQVLAPTAGRVLKVPVTVGTVVMRGETVATIARAAFRAAAARARAARALPEGRRRVFGSTAATSARRRRRSARSSLVYPQIEDGRVVADARVAGLGDYFRRRAHRRLDLRRRRAAPSSCRRASS